MKFTSLGRATVALLLAIGGLAACRPTNPNPTQPADPNLPIIFVHGFMGSGSQYRSQAMRFASNGFDPNRIRVFNYNTATIDSSRLNALVDAVRTEFNVGKVNLVGHSLGTSVVNSYVSNNAAKVNRFVLVDGVGCPTGNANCLVIRASELGQTHVEASVSAESFDRQYRFFTGKAPTTTAITPENGPIRIGGYVLNLQTNVPSPGQAELWELNSTTGARVGATPKASFTVAVDGSWGPVTVEPGKYYEIAATRAGGLQAHYYYEPFIRSTNFLHLITSPPDGAAAANTNRGPNHMALVVQRQREMWRSHGARNDTLRITAGGQTANVFQNVTGDVIGVHIHDDTNSPGVSSLSLLNYFRSQPFQTGVDVFIPAANPANGTVVIANTYRGDASKVQRVAVPNWPSNAHHVIVELNDYA